MYVIKLYLNETDVSGDSPPPATCGYNPEKRVHYFCCKERKENDLVGKGKAKLVQTQPRKGRRGRYIIIPVLVTTGM